MIPIMAAASFPDLDPAAASRALSRYAEDAAIAEVFCERLESSVLATGEATQQRTEEGLAVRIVERTGRARLASRDRIDGAALESALQQAVSSRPLVMGLTGELSAGRWPAPPAAELEHLRGLESRLLARIAEERVAFPVAVKVTLHRRSTWCLGPDLAPGAQLECFAAVEIEQPGGRFGTLLTVPDDLAETRLAETMVARFLAREAPPTEAGTQRVLLAPSAVAVLLHEAIGHGMEADLLARSPWAAISGEIWGGAEIDVLDDPTEAPLGVRRSVDDEGMPTMRRWLIRAGKVEDPIADRLWAGASDRWHPGGGRRSGRHSAPLPRCSHLEMLPGSLEEDDQMPALDDGIWVQRASRGRLDPLTGRFAVEIDYGRRVEKGRLGTRRRGGVLCGRLDQVLHAVTAVGSEAIPAGAGWCAKDGQRLPVWARAPAVLLNELEVVH